MYSFSEQFYLSEEAPQRKYVGGQELPVYPCWEVSPREKGVGWEVRQLGQAVQDDGCRGAQWMQREGLRALVPLQILHELFSLYLQDSGPRGFGAV